MDKGLGGFIFGLIVGIFLLILFQSNSGEFFMDWNFQKEEATSFEHDHIYYKAVFIPDTARTLKWRK